MKYGKEAEAAKAGDVAELKYLSYKDLKKLVRLISSAQTALNGKSRKAKVEIVYLLNMEIDKFNAFFMEQKEVFIIRNQELQERTENATSTWGPNGSQPSKTTRDTSCILQKK